MANVYLDYHTAYSFVDLGSYQSSRMEFYLHGICHLWWRIYSGKVGYKFFSGRNEIRAYYMVSVTYYNGANFIWSRVTDPGISTHLLCRFYFVHDSFLDSFENCLGLDHRHCLNGVRHFLLI